jgi:hypothetical protein
MRQSGSRVDRRQADPVRAELKKLLGDDFPRRRTEATRFVSDVEIALERYIFPEALRQSEDDSRGAEQFERVLKCAKQLLELLQHYDSIQPYIRLSEVGARVERRAFNGIPRVFDMIGRLKQGNARSFSTATVRENLQWLIETSTDIQGDLRTDWDSAPKPKRQRGRPAGRRAAQVELALGLAISLLNARIVPKLDQEPWKSPNPTSTYVRLVKWALARSPKRTKKGWDKGGDWSTVARLGLKELHTVINDRGAD